MQLKINKGGYCCSNVRGTIGKDFKLNEHLFPTGKENLNIWPCLTAFNPEAEREPVQKVVSYDVREGVKRLVVKLVPLFFVLHFSSFLSFYLIFTPYFNIDHFIHRLY